MDITKVIQELKSKIDEDKEKQQRAEGAMQAILDQLKKDFGVDSIEEAQDKLTDMQRELKVIEQSITEDLESFKGKYGL